MQFCVELTPPDFRNLTTLDRVKQAAQGPQALDGTFPQAVLLPADDEIARLIRASSDEIEKFIRRQHQLVSGAYTEKFSGDGSNSMMLSVTPVASIDAVYFRDVAVTDVDWMFDPTTGIVYKDSGWDFTGRIAQWIEPVKLPNSGKPDWQIDYTAGYSVPDSGDDFTLPYDIEQACIRTVLQWVQTQHRDLTIQRTRIGDVTQTYFAGTSNLGGALGLPSDVLDMLKPYMRLD